MAALVSNAGSRGMGNPSGDLIQEARFVREDHSNSARTGLFSIQQKLAVRQRFFRVYFRDAFRWLPLRARIARAGGRLGLRARSDRKWG